jgi:hypothetical protein
VLTTLPPSCADCLAILEPYTSWKPQGLSRPVVELLHFYLVIAVVVVVIVYFSIIVTIDVNFPA